MNQMKMIQNIILQKMFMNKFINNEYHLNNNMIKKKLQYMQCKLLGLYYIVTYKL